MEKILVSREGVAEEPVLSPDGESLILETAADFRAYAEDVIARGKERLANERGQS